MNADGVGCEGILKDRDEVGRFIVPDVRTTLRQQLETKRTF